MNTDFIGYFNSNDQSSTLGFGKIDSVSLSEGDSLNSIQKFIDENKGNYIFVCLSYDLKNTIEELHSDNPDYLQFPTAFLWVPQYVVKFSQNEYIFEQGQSNDESESFIQDFKDKLNSKSSSRINLNPRISKTEYLKRVHSLLDEIQNGNIYEINFCQEFYAEKVEIDNPTSFYNKINQRTKAPFSSYITINGIHIFCGSPERFIKKTGNKLVSSPIKGTQKRGSTADEDELLKTALSNDAKEKSENVMIVDLVRNDLSKIASKNTVHVDELFGIYTFESVHQMVSTISCEIRNDVQFIDIIKALFPMGSMTGAPKIRAMQLIEEHENFKRGIYSGSVGYITPNGDFDLNVIIRTLLYNSNNKYASCSVGGALTINSDPNKEYEECLIKIESILKGINE